jgi:hypothetical protein
MDFLKKHYDKVLLMAVLVATITSAIVLAAKVSVIRGATDAEIGKKLEGINAAPLDMTRYRRALDEREHPFQWPSGLQNLFAKGRVIVDDGPATGLPLRFMPPFRYEPFKLLFKAYTRDGVYALNVRDFSRTYFVRLNEEVEGYAVMKFEPKTVSRFNPRIGATVEEDVSELTLQRPNERPIVLVLGRVAEYPEPIATLRGPGGVDIPVRYGQSFTVSDRTFKVNVIDTAKNQVLISDLKSGEQFAVTPTGSVLTSGSPSAD